MDPTVLFTHLKIILLQYFHFSVFNKISYIHNNYIYIYIYIQYYEFFFFFELHNNIIVLLCPSSKQKFMVPSQLTSYNKNFQFHPRSQAIIEPQLIEGHICLKFPNMKLHIIMTLYEFSARIYEYRQGPLEESKFNWVCQKQNCCF